MYRVAICDDEVSTCNQLEAYVERYLESQYIKGETDIFFTGESLCDYMIEQNVFDLIFLDIELPRINGVQVGEYVRNTLKNEVIDIVYISSKTNYALELFKCRPLDFIIKPLSYETIEKTMAVAIKRNGVKNRVFEFFAERFMQKVLLQQIIYFRSNNKKVHIMLCSGEERIFNAKLSTVKEKLPQSLFLQIHKSFIINCDYVVKYSCECVEMINGDELWISKAHRRSVKEALMKRDM